IAPLQDLLNLGTESRMNFPGKPSGNWGWRFLSSNLSDSLAARMKEQNLLYGRL
ncbi:4-alpha-glucanotransferase, partial [bacterium]|nr:4-alpha-glucanotransferase [bacterium]